MMRMGLALWFLSAVCSLDAERRDSDLKSLFGTQRRFELRDAAETADTPAFYRVVVSCAFDDVRGAEKHFQLLRFLLTREKPERYYLSVVARAGLT